MFYIIAGNHAQALDFIKQSNLPVCKVKILSDVWSLSGIEKGFKYIKVGTFGERNDWPAIYATILNRQGVDVTHQFKNDL